MKVPRAEMKKARIEIIPMIDAIFFLLVFFMMTSLKMVQMNSPRVTLPESSVANKSVDAAEKVIVSVSKEGLFYVGQDQVQPAEITPLIARHVRENPDVTIIINCDRVQRVAQFVRVFDLVKQANAGRVMIATTPREPGS